jgi:hypothetical protein
VDNATCFCTELGKLGMFADEGSGCQNYFW